MSKLKMYFYNNVWTSFHQPSPFHFDDEFRSSSSSFISERRLHGIANTQRMDYIYIIAEPLSNMLIRQGKETESIEMECCNSSTLSQLPRECIAKD